MSAIDLSDYVAAGYFITKYTSDGFWHSSLLPDRLVSLSACIGKPLQVYWGWDIERHKTEILHFGIPEERLADLKKWGESGSGDYPDVFLTLNGARQFAAQFLPLQTNAVLVGAALRTDMVAEFLADNPQQIFDANNQVIREDVYGVNRVLSEGKPLEWDGDILGFEVVSYPGGFGHSWLCGGIEKDMHELYGIQPNQYGLISTDEEAKKVYDWIAEDDLQGHRGEPEPYYPWLLVQYPLAESAA